LSVELKIFVVDTHYNKKEIKIKRNKKEIKIKK